jgi:hypothetical protein
MAPRGICSRPSATFATEDSTYRPCSRAAGLFKKSEASAPEDPLATPSPRKIEAFSYLVKGIAELLRIRPKKRP